MESGRLRWKLRSKRLENAAIKIPLRLGRVEVELQGMDVAATSICGKMRGKSGAKFRSVSKAGASFDADDSDERRTGRG